MAAESTKFARMFPLSQACTPCTHSAPLCTRSTRSAAARDPLHPLHPLHPLLTQHDLPKHETKREHAAFVGLGPPPNNLIAEKPSRDYTPPCYITLLFTDLGVLTPSAVSDELIKLFD